MSDPIPIINAVKDGRAYLLFYPRDSGGPFGGWIEGAWGPNPGLDDSDNAWETEIGSIGDPTHFIQLPKDPQ